jgi:hypothetical protein
MFKWLRKRTELIKGEADESMEVYGDGAYHAARKEARIARESGDQTREKFLSRVCMEIAKRTGIDIGVDTATRYLEEQVPYDAGPGLVINRPGDSTLH